MKTSAVMGDDGWSKELEKKGTLRLRLSELERSLFFAGFGGSALVFLVGSAVRVPFGSTPIPVSQAWRSVQWDSMFNAGEGGSWFIALGVAAVLGVCYTAMGSWRARVLVLSTGLLAALLVLSNLLGSAGNAVMLIGYSLPAILSAVLGFADGEFYVEQIPSYAAAGSWMLLCIVFLLREFIRAAAVSGQGGSLHDHS